MIENLLPRDELIGFARQQAKRAITKPIHGADLEEMQKAGWQVKKHLKKKRVLVFRDKPRPALLEGRVWTLLYQMGFDILSGKGGAKLVHAGDKPDGPENQLDCVAVDNEVALAVECRTAQESQKDSDFQGRLAKFSTLRKTFSDDVRKQFESDNKRQIGMLMFVWDLLHSETDHDRAEDQNVVVFNEKQLTYFEDLVKHLGIAARYQFLADVFPGKPIPGLEIKVPALQTKIGNFTAYTFSIQPEYLLKIAFISHKARGEGVDATAYQRMIKKPRLKKIAKYISSEDAYFPTNVVLNIEKSKYVRFDLGKQEGSPQGAKVGWLYLSPAYKSAWVIDGQHRLFAYAGHKRAATSRLHVLAFDGLPSSIQMKLFVDINHEQKSVKRNLLDDLWAELHWDASDDEKRMRAVASKAIKVLNEKEESQLYQRILLSDEKSSDSKCITLSSLVTALDMSFFIVHLKKNVTEHGPLWAGDNDSTMKRTMTVVGGWLDCVAKNALDWWNLGAGQGGGLATNNGVTVCINVLKSVLEYLEKKGYKLVKLSDHEVSELLASFGTDLGKYLSAMSADERAYFRSLQGGAGQSKGTKIFQEGLHNQHADFLPTGLLEFMESKKNNNNVEGREITTRIEHALQDRVLSVLKAQFIANSKAWWFDGVPLNVRTKVRNKMEESGAKAGSEEQNFDIVHYREIIKENWLMFQDVFGYETGSKDKQTSWINEVNSMRNIVNHPSRREHLTNTQLNSLRNYDAWLKQQLAKPTSPTSAASSSICAI
jgi:DNA sulfur modification protein DndB